MAKPHWEGEIECCHCHKQLQVTVARERVGEPAPPAEYNYTIAVVPARQAKFGFDDDEGVTTTATG